MDTYLKPQVKAAVVIACWYPPRNSLTSI